MKILSRILSIALLLPALSVFVSCSEEQDGYVPAPLEKGGQVYFNSDNTSSFTVTDVQNTFELSLGRVDTAETASYDLKVVADEATLPLFNIPAAVAFEKGEAFAKVACTANTTEMEYDKTYTVKVCVANAQDATLYGQDTLTISVTCPAPWKSLGMAKFAENFLDGSGTYYDVEVQQNELAPNNFRLVEPYAEILGDIAVDKYLEFFILPAGSEFADFTTDAEYVIFNDYNMGQWNSNYAEDIFALHPYRFGRTPDKWNYNVVLEYQENGLPGEVSLAPLYYLFNEGGGWDKTTANTISILFPGYVKADYSASVEFAGIFTAKDGKIYATGDLTLGADASDVKAIVMPADVDAAAVADAIAAGELEAVDVKAGRIEVPFNAEELGGNNFQIIVVVLAEGAVKSVATNSFEYYGAGNSNPWQSLGTGFYTDDVLVPLFYEGGTPVTYEVEILEHTENPGLYRIMDPYAKSVHPLGDADYAPEGLYIEVNATDAEGVYIQQQSLGMDWGYGEMQLVTNGARYLASNPFEVVKGAGYLGKVAEGVIVFPTFTQSNGATYQAILFMGESGYLAGMNSKMEITLPGANAFARNMAIAKANTTKREMAKKSFSGAKANLKLKKLLNLQAEECGTPNS
ncbi:MAG: hypothetical protein IJZ11_02390 [Bacteroidaceae bacterium]|nr:hypothetical protein [Bacteroidaceae bacterium]